MADTMNIEDYLAQGGVLTAPGNAPARYRGELMRLMSSFVDSELAASAGFAASTCPTTRSATRLRSRSRARWPPAWS